MTQVPVYRFTISIEVLAEVLATLYQNILFSWPQVYRIAGNFLGSNFSQIRLFLRKNAHPQKLPIYGST